MTNKPQTVLITGCSETGIGHGLCLEFQKRGYHVFATARNPGKMGRLGDLPNVTPITLDVTSEESIQAAYESVHSATNGTLDVLINNAAAAFIKPIVENDIKAAKAIFDVNFWGPFAMMQKFTPLLIATKGCVVNISTFASTINFPFMGIYCASKAALENISRCYGLELEPWGIRVITVMTGAVRTEYYRNLPELELAPDSLYKSVESLLIDVTNGIDPPGVPKRTSVSDFARQIANDVDRKTSGTVWHGTGASLVHSLLWLPWSVLNIIIRAMSNMNVVHKAVQAESTSSAKKSE